MVRISALDRKFLRDLWRLRWQVLAIALLIACGVAVAVMAFSAQEAMTRSRDQFYAETRFADVFAYARRAPLSRAQELARIPGVDVVDVRIVEAGLMDVPGLARPAIARVISLPASDSIGLNGLTLDQGRMPDPASLDEVVALGPFMTAAGVKLGDRLTVTLRGRAYSFAIVGKALSPEYVYAPAPESFMPDDAHQAVFWAPRPAVERAAGMTGAFNTVALDLAPGASGPAVMAALDRILKPYGGQSAYARKDQVSHAFVQSELRELSTSATILPPVFLLVAAVLVHMVIVRLAEAEREQIGLFKAFGYSDRQAAGPYLKLSLFIGLIGAAAGGLAGAWLGAAIIDLYRQYFRFPVLTVSFNWAAFALGSIASIAAAGAGSIVAVRRAVALSPSVAMQPPRPARYRRGWIDRLFPRLDASSKMIVRNIERFPWRAGLAISGLAASLSLLVGTQFVFGALDGIVDQTNYRAQRWSDVVGFGEARQASAGAAAARLPGVFAAEPVRVVSARFKANGREEASRIVGLEPDALLARPLDRNDDPIPLVGRGLVLNEALAQRLEVHRGDMLRVEITDGRQPQVSLPVLAIARDYSGFSTYMSRRELNRIMADGDLASGAQLLTQPDLRPEFYSAIEATPQIVATTSRDETVASWRKVMVEAFRTTMTFYVGFAAAIAFGVAFNTTRIALSERARDLATMRVLGFGQTDCAYVLLGELLILSLAAIPLGLLGGNALAHGLVAAYSREDLRLPAIISAGSYGISLSAYVLAVLLAAVLVGRRVWTLDLVSVLKTRE